MDATASVSFPSLGTTAVIVTAPQAIAAATAEVEVELERIDLAASRFRPDSDLSRVNDAGGRWVLVGDLPSRALEVAIAAAHESGGAVDPTVGQSLVALGYDRDFASVARSSAESFATARAPGWRAIEFDRERSRVRVPAGVRLDLGATAKALAADRAALRAATATACGVMVGLGGDIAVSGAPPEGGWRIALADDHADARPSGESIAITAGGVATSSTTVRRWSRGGMTMHHVVDPRTGRPAREVWRTVSVAAATCVAANVATTAAIVLGEAAPAWLSRRRLPARLVRVDGRIDRVGGWPSPTEVAA